MKIDIARIASELERLAAVSRYNLDLEARTPSYCAGCPHRGSSSAIVEIRARFRDPAYMKRAHGIDGTIDIISHGGIGCYSLNFLPPFRDMHNMSAMGLGGAAGAGAYPFTRNKHYVMCGDSTFFHSEMSTLSHAIKDNQDILYLILDNKNAAMTGHQVTPASAYDIMGYKTIQQDIESVVRGMDPHGKVFITRTDPSKRESYLPLLERAFLMEGVRVIIADRECGITFHKRRRAGERRIAIEQGFLREEKHINISEEVCENCRECTVATGCPGLTTADTPYGEKIAIDRSICVDDKYCTRVKACPSFEQVIVRRRRKPPSKTGNWDLWMKDIPDPRIVPVAKGNEKPEGTKKSVYSIFIPGVGGMGLGFIAKILTVAGWREGFEVNFYHQKGLAQRNGAVVSHVLFSGGGAHVSQRIPEGKADLILGLDYLETVRGLNFSDPTRTTVVCNTAHTPTILMLMGEDGFPAGLDQRIAAYSKAADYFGADFFDLAEYYLGNRVYANLMMLGAAYQKGLLPVLAATIEDVIREVVPKGERENNFRAFRIGRRLVSHPEMLHIGGEPESFNDLIDRKRQLFEKKNRRLAHAYKDRVMELTAIMTDLPEDLRREFARRYADLIEYDGIEYAERYARRVLEVFWVETERRKEKDRLFTYDATEAVIWNLYKVMAIKDEVWVAHLLTSDEKRARDRERYNVDPARGDRLIYRHINRPEFVIFGKTIMWDMTSRDWMLAVMKRMKFLRPLLRGWHKTERTFRDWYAGEVIDAYIEGQFANKEDALRALQCPASCTGYRNVIYPKYARAQAMVLRLLDRVADAGRKPMTAEDISHN